MLDLAVLLVFTFGFTVRLGSLEIGLLWILLGGVASFKTDKSESLSSCVTGLCFFFGGEEGPFDGVSIFV